MYIDVKHYLPQNQNHNLQSIIKILCKNMQSAFVFIQVPKYVSEKWKKATGKCEVGKLKITRSK